MEEKCKYFFMKDWSDAEKRPYCRKRRSYIPDTFCEVCPPRDKEIVQTRREGEYKKDI